jgi:hypothetical protein
VKCGSENSIDGVRILERFGEHGLQREDLSAVAFENPDALFFKGEVATSITGRVCGDCGYLELYVTNPGDLLLVATRRAGMIPRP